MQTVKSVKRGSINTKTIALTAMFAALVTVTTAFIKLPAPLGYAHAGDSMVYLAACALPFPLGFIAAGIGGALADLISGYAVFALPTAIIKALNVLPFLLVRLYLSKKQRDDRLLRIPTALALIPTSLITVGGYFLANMMLFDRAYAVTETPFNLVQSAVGAALFIALALALDAIKFKQKLKLN